MIYDLDKCLKEPLTKDRDCEVLYDNLKGIYEAGQEESRHIGDEIKIKLNRLERKETPMNVKRSDANVCYCPVCNKRFDVWTQITNYCTECGQRLQL